MIHAPVDEHWSPLSDGEKRRGAKLLREAAEIFEMETYSGGSTEDALTHVLAQIAGGIYVEPSSDVRAMLVYAFLVQMARTPDEEDT